MTADGNRNTTSMDTILTFENRNASQWSMIWSTAHVPGMDTATGSGPTPARGPDARLSGRRRLRAGAFALGALLTMHCKVAAAAITGGFFVFIMFLMVSVALLANPLRHFEVYLGQWSISGPGRAFRIIPVFDGIGIAICINAILRAIVCCTVAAITVVYVVHSASDERLPYTYCRNFNLNTYEPITKEIIARKSLKYPWVVEKGIIPIDVKTTTALASTVGMFDRAWRNISLKSENETQSIRKRPRTIKTCNVTVSTTEGYPPALNIPPYNFFYVDVVRWRPHLSLAQFNVQVIIGIVIAWLIIWIVMLFERISYGMLIWNNMYLWIIAVPWVWTAVLGVATISNLSSMHKIFSKAFHFDAMETFVSMSDALEVAMYIHSASTGTEIIHGKGLNHYASGHIDPALNSDNIWHSGLLILLAVLNSMNATVCMLSGYTSVDVQDTYFLYGSAMWVIPMYSRCIATGVYSHFLATLTFAGLTFSYMVVAYVMLKTALHTIFEYKVKLVFIEQFVVAGLILFCMGSSIIFATSGGLALLEAVDALLTGVATPLVCFMELTGLLCMYRGRDFVSDMNVATEDNTCSTRISTQWQVIPIITLVTLLVKLSILSKSKLPPQSMYLAMIPLLAVVMAMPVRACASLMRFIRCTKNR